ncbi:hypothetical protein C8F04DRAFT_1355580 [Mycena alexandri]|uniref:Uncharacterized protein n=1 Tax=Mycena alexandri TaxID=1745969 RepID=A0AAD6SS10_9AGAR|nr:hypothetical protein C8F04DRAFT_1355580 [Mycena alexandri]
MVLLSTIPGMKTCPKAIAVTAAEMEAHSFCSGKRKGLKTPPIHNAAVGAKGQARSALEKKSDEEQMRSGTFFIIRVSSNAVVNVKGIDGVSKESNNASCSSPASEVNFIISNYEETGAYNAVWREGNYGNEGKCSRLVCHISLVNIFYPGMAPFDCCTELLENTLFDIALTANVENPSNIGSGDLHLLQSNFGAIVGMFRAHALKPR